MNSKKQRKFRVWDNSLLYTTMQKVAQVVDAVDQKCKDHTTPDQLPQSIVPTDVLYDVCACYLAMYDKLEAEELLQSGYPRGKPTTH
jgi:hypothetical protein